VAGGLAILGLQVLRCPGTEKKKDVSQRQRPGSLAFAEDRRRNQH